jgi:hypothetical protein
MAFILRVEKPPGPSRGGEIQPTSPAPFDDPGEPQLIGSDPAQRQLSAWSSAATPLLQRSSSGQTGGGGERVVLSALDQNSRSRLWLARMDGRVPPRKILDAEGFGPVFGDRGEVYFRASEGSQWSVFALNPDTGMNRKLIPEPTVDTPIVSPDRKWAVVTVPVKDRDATTQVKAFPIGAGKPFTVCERCFIKWTRDQKTLFVAFRATNAMSLGETFMIPIPSQQTFPKLPESGLTLENISTCCGSKAISGTGVFPGVRASQYAYVNPIAHRNFYRFNLSR